MNSFLNFKVLIIGVLCFSYSVITAQNLSHPVVDAHCHIRAIPSDAGELIKIGVKTVMTMEEYFDAYKSVDIKYLFGISQANKGNIKETRTRNDSLFTMSRRDSRFVPVYSIHPMDGKKAFKELHRVKDLGGKIIKIPVDMRYYSIAGKKMYKFAIAAGELDLVLLIDGCGFIYKEDYLGELLQLTRACPDTKFIIAHMGCYDWHKLGMVFSSIFKNVWYDLSATVITYADSPYKAQFEWVIRSVGVDRVLFGSDQPVCTLLEALDAFYKLDFDDTERERILYKNAIELLSLPSN